MKRIEKSMPMPEYQTGGAVAFDFYAREEMVIEAGAVGRIATNLVIKVPSGYVLLIKDRSSTAKKKGLLITAGVIDEDYCGDEDEILVQFYNPGEEVVKVEKGERLAQGLFVKIDRAEWKEVEKMGEKSRGGFGTTGS